MKYYTIVTSRDEKVIGKYPQVKTNTMPYEWLKPPLNSKIRYDIFLDFDKYFDIILDDDAILTAMIERVGVSWGIIINDKFKNILIQFNIPPHRFYPINVIHQGDAHQYYWFHFYINIFNYIDLEKSTFEVFNTANFKVIEELPVTSEKFIRDKQNSFAFQENMRLNKLVFNQGFPEYDIWMNNVWGFSNLISRKLLNVLNESQITGFEYQEQNIIGVL